MISQKGSNSDSRSGPTAISMKNKNRNRSGDCTGLRYTIKLDTRLGNTSKFRLTVERLYLEFHVSARTTSGKPDELVEFAIKLAVVGSRVQNGVVVSHVNDPERGTRIRVEVSDSGSFVHR